MSEVAAAANASSTKSDGFVRLGGIAGLLLVLTALILNFVLVTPSPAFNAPVDEIAEYVTLNAPALATSNTLRYAIYLLLPFFGVALARFVEGPADGQQRAWALVGLFGAIWLPAVGTIGNSVEAAGIWQADIAAQQPQLLMTIWSVGGALFIAAQLAWGTLIMGFSVAGSLTGVIPRWLASLGLVTAATCFVGALGIQSVMNGGWAQVPWFASIPLFAVWVAIVSVLMIRRSGALSPSRVAGQGRSSE